MRLLLALGVLLVSVTAEAQTFVQFKLDPTAQPFTDSVATITPDAGLSVGNAVCVGANMEVSPAVSVVSVTDNGSGGTNTYSAIQTATGGITVFVNLWCGVIERAATVVTVTVSANSLAQARVFLAEFTGTHPSSPFGGRTGQGTAGSTTHVTGTLNVQSASSVLWGYTFGGAGTYTIDASFTLNSGGDANRFVSGQKAVSGVNTQMTNTSAQSEVSASVLVEILPTDPVPLIRRVRKVGSE